MCKFVQRASGIKKLYTLDQQLLFQQDILLKQELLFKQKVLLEQKVLPEQEVLLEQGLRNPAGAPAPDPAGASDLAEAEKSRSGRSLTRRDIIIERIRPFCLSLTISFPKEDDFFTRNGRCHESDCRSYPIDDANVFVGQSQCQGLKLVHGQILSQIRIMNNF